MIDSKLPASTVSESVSSASENERVFASAQPPQPGQRDTRSCRRIRTTRPSTKI